MNTAIASPRPAPPPTPRYREKREAILAAGAALFNEHGVKGATLGDIAAAVGLATNSVTYYYRKKEDLARACLLRSIEAFDALAVAAATESGVARRVLAFFSAMARQLADIDRGRLPPLLGFSDIRALPSPHADEVFGAYTDMFRRVRGLLKGPETAGLSRDDLNARGHILLSVAHTVRTWIARFEIDDYAGVNDRLVDVLLHGLASPASAWQRAAAATPAARAAAGPGEAFLRAATILVNEQGYRGASVDRISARLNVTKGSFYHHHDNKHDLITECFERSFGVMRDALHRADAAGGSGWVRACAAARSLVRYQISDDGPLLRSTAISALPDDAHRARVRRAQSRLTEHIGSVLVDGIVDGSIRPLHPGIAAQSLVAAINAAAELHRWLPSATEANVEALYVRPALDGLLCAPAEA